MSVIPYKCIIIDDEPAAIQRLLNLTADFPETFEVIASVDNGKDAIDLINERQPDLIFLDIQMPEITGFELLKHLHKIPLIVFCTAYDQYALQAFETNSIDYLLKPVKKERFEQTIQKLKNIKNDYDTSKILTLLDQVTKLNSKKELTSITVRSNNRILFYKLEDIAYFKASDKYVGLFLKNGEEKLSDKTITQLEEELPDYFIRVHRSIIINTRFVNEIQVYFNCKYSILMNDDNHTRIISSRSFQNRIKEWMDS
jgi:two-component system, LytTR family, response regulator